MPGLTLGSRILLSAIVVCHIQIIAHGMVHIVVVGWGQLERICHEAGIWVGLRHLDKGNSMIRQLFWSELRSGV